jgi:tRNA(Met) cytidine acetyltransferase
VRLGVQRDEVSGQHSITLLKALSIAGSELVNAVKMRFEGQWPDLLAMQFSALDVKVALAISTQFSIQNSELSTSDKQDLLRFSRGMATYESCQIAIRNFVVSMLSQARFSQLSIQYQQLLVMRVLQLKSIATVAKDLSFKGKSDLTLALRQALVELSIEFATEDDTVITLK